MKLFVLMVKKMKEISPNPKIQVIKPTGVETYFLTGVVDKPKTVISVVLCTRL